MKIKTIALNNYKAFYKSYTFNVDGKNLFIYGENGSGKSSLYYALKDFFQSSTEAIDLNVVENIFLTKGEKGKGYIKVTFHPDKDGNAIDKLYSVTSSAKDTDTPGDTSISDAISLKSFLTYKNLLGVHTVKKGEEIDLFDLLVKGVLKHFKGVVTGGVELGELWINVENATKKSLVSRTYTAKDKERDVTDAIRTFNNAFNELFKPGGAEYLMNAAKPILDEFGYNLEVKLTYSQAKPVIIDGIIVGIKDNHVRAQVLYLKKSIPTPHLFMNEARLSAVAISIYLGMIKKHPQAKAYKILFLDDIFIGLDISNRLPLLEILKKYFLDYQIFITTYDKPWYEFVKSTYLTHNPNWKSFEAYSRRARKGFEIPIIKDNKSTSFIQNYIDTADNYFNHGDNKAAGVYLRSAFEYILKNFCFGKVPVPFQVDTSKLKTDALWTAVKKYKDDNPGKCSLTMPTRTKIDFLTSLVLNPLSHHDVNKHEISSEISSAITTMKTLKSELGV